VFVLLGAFTYASSTRWAEAAHGWNIVVGGLAGSFAVLAGAAAASPQPGPLPLLLALVLFLWTPPHFWSLAIANQADYAAAGVPMLPVVVGARARRASCTEHGRAGGGVAAAGVLRRRLGLWPRRSLGGAHFLRKHGGAGARARAQDRDGGVLRVDGAAQRPAGGGGGRCGSALNMSPPRCC
jgi:protoheme IX farnesyltransferase